MFYSAELQFINDRFLFSYPQDVSHFLWLYNISEFVDCDHNLANEMKNKYGLYQNKSQMNLVTLPMRTINTILNKLEKHYWLAGGTLLGKKNVFNFYEALLRLNRYC